MPRTLRITLEASSGSIDRFYAFVAGKRRIAASGEKARSWEGEVADQDVSVKLRVTGRGNASYKILILPKETRTFEYTLQDGYHEWEDVL